LATTVSTGGPPALSATCFFSASFIERDASQTSVVPLMSALIPVPEPPPVTWIVAPLCFAMYSSAQRWPRTTIVSEPLTVIGASSARAAPPRASVPKSAPTAEQAASVVLILRFVRIGCFPSLSWFDYSAIASRNENSCSVLLLFSVFAPVMYEVSPSSEFKM